MLHSLLCLLNSDNIHCSLLQESNCFYLSLSLSHGTDDVSVCQDISETGHFSNFLEQNQKVREKKKIGIIKSSEERE